MIERIDEKIRLVIEEILNKKVLLITHDDYMILQDYRSRRIAEEQAAEREAAWKEELGMMMGMLKEMHGMNGGGNDGMQ